MSWVTPQKFAERVVLSVCELPGYTSPDDQPELLRCTATELNACVVKAFEHFHSDPTPVTVEQSRAQFEAAMDIHDAFLKRDEWGMYEQTDVHYRWLGWELHRRTVSEGER